MLELSNIRLDYGHNGPVLSDVSLTVAPGEHVCLLGANGSGKSSLMSAVMGLTTLASGSVRIDGLDPFDEQDPLSSRMLLGHVGQRPDDQIVQTSVEDEVAFGPENLGLPREELRRRVDAAIGFVGLVGMEQREPHSLSGGQKQRLALAGALAMEPRYLLLDEPTSMLDPKSATEIRELFARLVAEGAGALHITHDLEQAADADKVAVIFESALAFVGTPDEFSQIPDATLKTWGLLAEPVVRNIPAERAVASADAWLQVEEVSHTYDIGFGERVKALDGVSLSVGRGDFVVIKGPSGSGKSTLLRVLAGLLMPESGEATYGGIKLSPKVARGKIGLMFQDAESALFAESVLEDVMFGPMNFGASKEEATTIATEELARTGLDPITFGGRSPFELSGGEARRVAIAGVLACRPEYLLADEPTGALDARGREAVQQLLADASQDCGVVVVTHAPHEFESMATSVYVFENGGLTEERR